MVRVGTIAKKPAMLSGPFIMEAIPNEAMESEPLGWDVNIVEGVGTSHGILEKAQGNRQECA